jgi:dipeptidyl aminopeptidase/acylaminoacyl peptidase
MLCLVDDDAAMRRAVLVGSAAALALLAAGPLGASGPKARQAARSVWNGDIYVVNADGAGRTRLTRDPAEEFSPAWSPDGTKIAFLRSFQALGTSNRPVYVMNADGTGQHQVTPGTRLAAVPTWQARGVGAGH